MALQHNLKLGIVMPPALDVLLRTALAIQGLLYFHMYFTTDFFYFCGECHWNFDSDQNVNCLY
jgi:hypothetical protein